MSAEDPGTTSRREALPNAEPPPTESGHGGAGMRGLARLSGAAVLILYLTSFALPVVDNRVAHFNHMSPAPRGLVLGWHAFLTGWFWPVGWAANPALWVGLILLITGRLRAAG